MEIEKLENEISDLTDRKKELLEIHGRRITGKRNKGKNGKPTKIQSKTYRELTEVDEKITEKEKEIFLLKTRSKND